MAKPLNKRVYLLLLLLIPIAFVLFLKQGSFRSNETLPIYGNRFLPTGETDSVFHTVGEFSLTDQKGNIFTQDTVKGKIRIANFFFARCLGTCPKMNSNVLMVYDKYKNSPDVVFISHTVDPSNDSAEVLDTYAQQINAHYKRWYFVTGKYDDIAEMQNQYLLPKADGSSTDQIAHSQYIILVDDKDRVRGAYDGLNINQVLKLRDDIKLLVNERNKTK